MTNIKRDQFIVDVISALFIFLFIYTSVNKIVTHSLFKVSLSEFPVIGNAANLLSWAIPLAELVTCVLLFFPSVKSFGLMSSLILMVIFTGYIGFIILFAPNRPCSCGGVLEQMTWTEHFLFNLFFTILSVLGLWLHSKNKLFIAINRTSRTPVQNSRQIF